MTDSAAILEGVWSSSSPDATDKHREQTIGLVQNGQYEAHGVIV